MEPTAIFDVLHRHLYLIVALFIVTTLAGYGISFFTPLIAETYDASAVVLVRPHNPIEIDQNNSGKEYLGFPVAQTPVVEAASKTYIQIIQSPALITEVVRELKLDQRRRASEVGGNIFKQIYEDIKNIYYDYIDPYVKDAIEIVRYGRLIQDDPFTQAVKAVGKGLSLKSYEDTYVFEIKYSADDPQLAAAVANTTARLFVEFVEKIRSAEAKDAAAQLKTELEDSRRQLVNARERLKNYQESHGVFLYKSEYDAELRVISDLTVELAKLDESAAASQQGTYEAKNYGDKRSRLVKTLENLRAGLGTLPLVERQLELLQADVDVANTTYDTVAKELKDAEIKSDPMPEARLISPAFVSRLPSHPRREIIVLVSAFTGLLVGVVLAFFLEYINRTVRGVDDIEDFVGLKVIGTIPNARS
jgi:uncharacterized protein involved in exopolysaccharide biosynthesis